MRILNSLHHRIRTTPWLGRAVLKSIPDLKVHVNVEPVGKMAIRLRQHRLYWLRPPLLYEGFMLGALQRFIHKGDVVYDIGANIGLYSRFMVQQFGASRVYAFEPMENNCSLLAENLKIAGCSSRVEIVPRAIGNEDGISDFQIDDLTSNSGTLDAVAHGAASQSRAQYRLPPVTVSLKVARLDTLVESGEFPRPDVIKMDVEGAEALALEGARSVLLQYRPRLVIELHGAEVAQQAMQILWSVGYRTFGYLNDGKIYEEFTLADLNRITGLYSAHYLAASCDLSDLRQPIESFTVSH